MEFVPEVAQLAERQAVTLDDAGSNPALEAHLLAYSEFG
jgi:hypothetical protein